MQGSLLYSRGVMCISVTRRVVSVFGDIAIMEDGRRVRLAGVTGVQSGDCLQVYADIAIEKVEMEIPKELYGKKRIAS